MRSFDDMATLGSPPTSPSPNRRPKRWARKCERYCCQVVTYFPLVFVYGLTSWAVWVEAGLGFLPQKDRWTGPMSSIIGIALYLLLNISYTLAVFTDPGSTLVPAQGGYSHLPTHESSAFSSLTVKSTGGTRFCKKCQAPKPDRAHHCSTCRRCVLKMDHHCPWVATCVGLRNYKSFMLFLIYTCFFCYMCFAVSATWVWAEIVDDGGFEQSLMPVHYVLLSVISGIIGLVLTGFTAWHVYLCVIGRTTIESLEKTRYLSPLKRQMQQQLNDRNYIGGEPTLGEQLREIHANALPGITRPEEGEERSSPAQASLMRNWSEMEHQREIDRYRDYQDERDSEKLPNAFDLGWKRNLLHVFGEKKLLWFIPVSNTTGDGWVWETNPKWIEARAELAREREASDRLQKERERAAGWNVNMASPNMPGFPHNGRGLAPRDADARHLGVPSNATPLRTLNPNGSSRNSTNEDSDDYDTSSDEQESLRNLKQRNAEGGSSNWNDVPDELLSAPRKGTPKGKTQNRRANGGDGWSDWNPS